jgi:hypothetical protein
MKYCFGTLKTGPGTGNVFSIHNKFRPRPAYFDERDNLYYVESEGCQTLYAAIVKRKKTINNHEVDIEELQLAFSSGSQKIITMILPHNPPAHCLPFSSIQRGKWYAVMKRGAVASKLKMVYPSIGFDPDLIIIQCSEIREKLIQYRYLTSSQSCVFWHIGRFFLCTSRTSHLIITEFSRCRGPAVQEKVDLLRFLGFEPDLTVDEPSQTLNTPEQYISAIQDKRELFSFLKRFKISGIDGRTAISTMRQRALQFFTDNPTRFVPPTPLSDISARILPIFLNSLLLKPYPEATYSVFKKGIENEKTMTDELPSALESFSEGRWKVVVIFETGLIADPESLGRSCATSPDRIATILDTISGKLHLVPVEYKTSVAEATQNDLRARRGFFEGIAIDHATMTHLVPEKSHHSQLLHHCATLSLKSILYVCGCYITQDMKNLGGKSIERISLVHFSPTILSEYKDLMSHFTIRMFQMDGSETFILCLYS